MTYPEPTNLTSLGKVFTYANTVSDNSFFYLLPVSLYLISFMWFKSKGFATVDCFSASGFVAALINTFLYVQGVVTGWTMFVYIALVFVPVLVSYLKK